MHGRTLGTAVVDALYNRTGGNPFFLEEILAAAGLTKAERAAIDAGQRSLPNEAPRGRRRA